MSEYFLSQDNDCHWYLIPLNEKASWQTFLNFPEGSEDSWNLPPFAQRVDGPHAICFSNPRTL